MVVEAGVGRALFKVFVPIGLAMFVALVVWRFFSPLAAGGLGLIDDHEIIRFLGPDHRVTLGSIPGLLASDTEVGAWGTSTRFRPVYYLWRLIETAMFGDDAGAWYVARMLAIGVIAWLMAMVGFKSLLGWASTRPRKGLMVGFVVGISTLVLTLPALPDSIMRLGPSEIYVGSGLAAATVGAFAIYRRPSRVGPWILAIVGVMIAVGSKEDAVVLVVPLLAIAFVFYPLLRHRVVTLVLVGVAVAFAGFVALGVLLAVVRKGSDQYGESRSVRHWLSLFPGDLFIAVTLVCLIVCIVLDRRSSAAGATRLTVRGLPGRVRGWLIDRPHVFLAGIAVFGVVADLYFYQNSFDNNGFSPSRYAFISDLCLVLAAATTVHLLLIRAQAWNLKPRIAVGVATAVVLIVSPLGGQVGDAFAQFRGEAAANAQSQRDFRRQLDSGIEALADGAQAVVLADSSLDYERSLSFSEFLNYYGNSPSVFLRVVAPQNATVSDQDRSLLDQLAQISVAGDVATWGVRPIADLDDAAPTVCFAFVQKPHSTKGCDVVRVIG